MTAQKHSILVVEDDPSLRMGLAENLAHEGYAVDTAEDGDRGLALGLEARHDLILLDVMLPGQTGYEVCRALRDKEVRTPIIMLTARNEEFDRVLGFDLGTDDYVTKPFSIKELLGRVRAVLRRVYGESREEVFRFGPFELDTAARTFLRDGVEVPLTRTEFDLLEYFLRHPGRALSREDLVQDVWGSQYFGTQRSLDSFVSCLRKKIEPRPSQPRYIHTVHGVGYKFQTDDA